MATLHLICGTIASGKTTYARKLMAEKPALLLSVDEVTLALEGLLPPEKHDATTLRVKQLLLAKARQALAAGLDVIFDWGFWQKEERAAMEATLRRDGIEHLWHYVDISQEQLAKQIQKRNEAVLKGETSAYYVDEGLWQKCLSLFEAPDAGEIHIRYTPTDN